MGYDPDLEYPDWSHWEEGMSLTDAPEDPDAGAEDADADADPNADEDADADPNA